jgi:hypothetical protein
MGHRLQAGSRNAGAACDRRQPTEFDCDRRVTGNFNGHDVSPSGSFPKDPSPMLFCLAREGDVLELAFCTRNGGHYSAPRQNLLLEKGAAALRNVGDMVCRARPTKPSGDGSTNSIRFMSCEGEKERGWRGKDWLPSVQDCDPRLLLNYSRSITRSPTSPIFSIKHAARESKLSYPTASAAIQRLTDAGILQESSGKRRDRLFLYAKYLDVLNRDL